MDSYLKWQLELELQGALDRFPGPALWVSHDRGEVYRNCRRVCVMENGKSFAATTMAALMTRPVTVSAARFSGCENFVLVQPGPSEGLVDIPDWGLTLRTDASWREGVTTLGIRADRVHPAESGDINAFPCRVLRAAEDVSFMLILLRPEGAGPSAPPLRMELKKDVWAALPDRTRLPAAICPEDMMLLE